MILFQKIEYQQTISTKNSINVNFNYEIRRIKIKKDNLSISHQFLAQILLNSLLINYHFTLYQ